MLGQLRTVVTVCTLHSGYGYVQHTIYTWLQKYEYKYCTFDGYVVDVSDLIIFHSFSLRDMSTLDYNTSLRTRFLLLSHIFIAVK